MRHKLTHRAVATARPRKTDYRLADGRQLYLLVKANGTRLWRLDYQIGGRRKTLSLGLLEDVALADARVAADEARRQVRDGTDPVDARRQGRARDRDARVLTFALAAAGYIERRGREADWSPKHRRTTRERIDACLMPWIGERPIADLAVAEVDACLARIVARGAHEQARRVLKLVRSIYAERSVEALVGPGAMGEAGADVPKAPPKRKRRHHAAVIDPRALGRVLRLIENHRGTLVVGTALRLTPLLLLRPVELRHLRWIDVRLDERMVVIPGERIGFTAERAGERDQHGDTGGTTPQRGMKGGEDLLVPLARQSADLLEALHRYTGGGGFVFPSTRSRPDVPLECQRPMSENTINAALRSVGIAGREQSAHGFRASARSLLPERLGYRESVVEIQIAHTEQDAYGNAYARAAYIDTRTAMMQAWADFCDGLRADAAGAVVVPFARTAS